MPGAADRLLNWFAAKLAARVEDQLAVRLQSELARHVNEKLLPEVGRRADAEARDAITRQIAANPLIGSRLYVPSPAVDGGRGGDYMATSTPLTRDFLHAKFAEFLGLCGLPPLLHRKLWEW